AVWRTPLRHFVRGSKVSSRAHMDRTYLNCAVDSCVTIWVPLGDCPLRAGGLLYLEKSHASRAIETMCRECGPTDRTDDRRPLTHDLKWLAEATGLRWLGTDCRAGDVILHSPVIVHASTDPQIDPMRVSTDIRFLRADAHDDSRWQRDWAADDGYCQTLVAPLASDVHHALVARRAGERPRSRAPSRRRARPVRCGSRLCRVDARAQYRARCPVFPRPAVSSRRG